MTGMSKVIYDISVSVHGFITAANQTPEDPMGQDPTGSSGQILHEWASGPGDASTAAGVTDTQRPDAPARSSSNRRFPNRHR